ncbi:hypothetical protein DM47_3120 [Burkholderia mallei]|nr:hypothetical protein DO65_6235 [Burkholderia pseudomallei]KGC62124.1 hypothetical protein DM75_3068 [Burkholderia mallei]KGD22429.1 hypothetical protein DO70_5076 [Burkholderia pseudomallei]KOS91755.1 hypothetical protein DM49_3728 [Burkholderia mallei]KOS94560.1 hypothetical protein DM45_3527 [Burkholderia mallei]
MPNDSALAEIVQLAWIVSETVKVAVAVAAVAGRNDGVATRTAAASADNRGCLRKYIAIAP